jgi:phenylpropionate dioxygenase-like ring-hydroxylating dioxygenase large terminal subunit
MFPRNFWYVGAMAHEVGRHLLPRTILEDAVVFFRRTDGSVAALADRCSHRKVSLALGRLIGDDVQCGYHGLTFAGDGSCTGIPGQTRIPPKACVRSYPVIEKDGFVWIWPGDAGRADERLVPDYADICSSGRYAGLPAKILVVQAPCAFNIENVLDLSHVSYVHQETVGTPEVAHTRPTTKITDSCVEVSREWDCIASGLSFKRLFGWDNVKRRQRIIFWPGGNIRLEIDVEPVGNTDPSQRKRIRVAGPCTPSTAATHYKFSAMYRDFAHDDEPLTTGMAEQFRKTILEDQALMEDQQRNWRLDGVTVLDSMSPSSSGGMFDLAVDQAPLAARRMLQQLAATERSAVADLTPASLLA